MTYTDKELDAMRGQLARTWRQHKSQVTDTEARFYLDIESEMASLTAASGEPKNAD